MKTDKKLRRPLALLLVFTFMFALGGVSAFAEGEAVEVVATDEGGSISMTVNGEAPRVPPSGDTIYNVNVVSMDTRVISMVTAGVNGSSSIVPGSSAINADVSGNVEPAGDDHQAYVYAFSSGEKADTTVTLNGDVYSSRQLEEDATVNVKADKGGTTAVTIDGSVSASSADGAAFAVDISATEGGQADFAAGGSVTADGQGLAAGINVNGTGESSVATGTVEGDVNATAMVVNDGDSPTGEAYGACAEAVDGGKAGLIVNGNITATLIGTAEFGNEDFIACALEALADGEGAEANAAAKGNVRATADDYACAAYALAENGGTARLTVDGNLDVEAEEAYGITVIADGKSSNAEANINGNVTASRTENSAGALLQTEGGSSALTVEGNVTASGKIGEAIYITADSGDGAVGKVTACVKGNVTGEYSGLAVWEDDASSADVTVEGILSAKGEDGTAIVVSEDVTADRLKLTVWKIEPNQDGNLVAERSWDENENRVIRTTETTKEIEQSINYIIKVEPSQAELFAGTQETAVEGESAVVKLTVPSGYRLDGAYTDEGKSVELLKDASGNYYVVMPRGGGVYLSASLSPISAEVADLSVGSNSTVRVMDGSYIVVLSSDQAGMTFLRSTLERFQKLSDRFIIKTEKGSYVLSLSELFRFNPKAQNFRFTLTDEALEIYVNGELFRTVGFAELI